MAELVFVALAIGTLLVAVGWRGGARAWQARQRRHVAEVCLVLLGLVQELQLHRGLSGALLDRRSGFRGELDASERKLRRSLHALAERYGARHIVFREQRWRILLGRWEALRNNWQGLAFETNVYAHGEVICGLLGILKSLARDNARLLGEPDARAVSDWPPLIEDLGLLRAFGLHLLARRSTVADDTLVEAITVRVQTADARLRQVAGTGVDPALVARSDRALRRVRWLLDGNAARYHPYTFYEEMTAVVDDWYGLLCTRLRAAGADVTVARGRMTLARPQPRTG